MNIFSTPYEDYLITLCALAIASAVIAALSAALLHNIRRRKDIEKKLSATAQDLVITNAQLCRSNLRFFDFANSLPYAIYEVDLKGSVTFANQSAMKALGYSVDDLKSGINALDLVVPGQSGLAAFNFSERVRGASLEPVEYMVKRKNGDYIPLMISSVPIYRNEEIVGFRALAIDNSEKKVVEKTLRESEGKYRSLFEESRDGIFVSSPDGKFLDINQACVNLFRYPSKDALMKANIDSDIYCRRQDREEYHRILKRDGFVQDYEVDLKTKDGGKINALLTATAVYDDRGEMTELRGIIRDITEYKLLEAQLLQAQKMEAIGQLAGGISHDFNNILTTILGYADLLKGHLNETETSKKYFNEMLISMERAASLTRSLLAFSRKQTLNIVPVDLNVIVKDVAGLLSRLIGEDIDVRTNLLEKPLMALADSHQIEQVMLNIANNARDAMPNGGLLALGTNISEHESHLRDDKYSRPGAYAVITIADSGSGMDEKTAQKIFEPFFTTKEVGKGTGLGLAIAYGIVSQHDGKIDVLSSPGYGSTFRIFLPLIKPEAIVTSRNRHMSCPLDAPEISGVVLLAEDNESVRSLMTLILQKAGYSVIEAHDGDEAVKKFIMHPEIDLVILDVIMPRKDGRQAYREIINMRPDAKVLLASGYTPETLKRKGVHEDFPSIMQKPLAPQELLRNVREAIAKESPGVQRT
jgi:PAS domain S-box-containing protein